MKQIKRILAALFFTASLLTSAVSCTIDRADNPKFKEGEIYIYCNYNKDLATAVGVPMTFNLLVSPNDGSVDCRWLLDGVIIAETPSFVYTFDTVGEFSLRFEAEKDGKINYRQFTLKVTK